MNYHNITKDDMNNGDGLRVVLWVAGCDHHCSECHNISTWSPDSGIEFDLAAKKELFEELKKEYIAGITFSGGDPLHELNVNAVARLAEEIKNEFPSKTIWLYTGYKWDDISENRFESLMDTNRWVTVLNCDIVVDGVFEKDKADVNYHWAGSTNQRVIDVQKSLEIGKTVIRNS